MEIQQQHQVKMPYMTYWETWRLSSQLYNFNKDTMTIASEITRLQNDKAAICAAIEDKGVTVGNASLDDYAACVAAIST